MISKALLLDIDGVLLDHHNEHEDGVTSHGFTSWTRPDAQWFNWLSHEQLDLITASFAEIFWHTTWSLHGMANTTFNEVTGFGPFVDLIDLPNDGRADNRAEWWKLATVRALIEEGVITSDSSIVWADDDHPRYDLQVNHVLRKYDLLDNFRIEAPTRGIWGQQAIENSAQWLDNR